VIYAQNIPFVINVEPANVGGTPIKTAAGARRHQEFSIRLRIDPRL
jgi:hypothetical protein